MHVLVHRVYEEQRAEKGQVQAVHDSVAYGPPDRKSPFLHPWHTGKLLIRPLSVRLERLHPRGCQWRPIES